MTPTINFEFISNNSFRAEAESDARELDECLKVGAWKAAHVLAGSLVEAILAEYLSSRRSSTGSPEKMGLDDLIDACAKQKILSNKTVGLTNVVREYRNLIHPGRVVRLGEQATEAGAKVAAQLVAIVSSEIAKHRQENYGFSAGQLVAKFERDPSAIAYVSHLLAETPEAEREKLLLEVAPTRHAELMALEPDDPALFGEYNEERVAIKKLFRACFESVSDQARKEVCGAFARRLRRDDRAEIYVYASAFFRGGDFQYMDAKDRPIVMAFLLSEHKSSMSHIPRETLEGLWSWADSGQFSDLITVFVRRSIGQVVRNNKNHWLEFSLQELLRMSESKQAEALELLREFERKASGASAEVLAELINAAQGIPF